MIDHIREEHVDRIWNNYNDASKNKDFPHAQISRDEFLRLFLNNNDREEKIALIEEESGSWLSASFDKRLNKYFVSFIYVPQNSRRKEIATDLLEMLEGQIKDHKKDEKAILELSFFNPNALRWIVPGTDLHEHPNAPGIEIGSPAYFFFQSRGFRNFAYQNSYYLDLQTYEFPERILRRIEEHSNQGITYEQYDKNTMTGFMELFEDLGNTMWRDELGAEVSEDGQNRPIIVPLKDNCVYGFTGPLDVQENGRGYFAGIAVHSAMRGQGIAKVLFNKLCAGLKDMGASYMTLFTGENNPARNIYEAAGFRLVKTWADMRKEIV